MRRCGGSPRPIRSSLTSRRSSRRSFRRRPTWSAICARSSPTRALAFTIQYCTVYSMAERSQLLRGVTDLLVLSALSSGRSYGYELVERLQQSTVADVNEATVYATL